MPFDNELVMHDGTTITADITPVSLTRTDGSVVIDLREFPAKGLACVLVVGATPTGTSPTLDVSVQECDTVNGTYVTVAKFPQVNAIGTWIRRFSAEKRYVRALLDVGGTNPSFTNVFVLLAYHPFKTL